MRQEKGREGRDWRRLQSTDNRNSIERKKLGRKANGQVGPKLFLWYLHTPHTSAEGERRVRGNRRERERVRCPFFKISSDCQKKRNKDDGRGKNDQDEGDEGEGK